MNDLYLTCRSEDLEPLIHALDIQFLDCPEVEVLDWNRTTKLQQGYIVLEWLDEVDPAFLAQLQNDPRVLDFCVYSVPSLADEYPFGLDVACPCGGIHVRIV
jgi:hypothetical protein